MTRVLSGLVGLAICALISVATPAHADALVAQSATVKTESNLRAAPTTTSAVLTVLPAGTRIDVLCWTTGEPTYGTDVYGTMWLFTTQGGWVHSFLVTPVEVAPCASYGTLYGGLPGGAYANCDQAIAAGAAPVLAGRPGYGPHLDRDLDGIGCEWDE